MTDRLRVLARGPSLPEFCQRWRITEVSVFGSALRDDFGPDSDVDVLVRFADDTMWGLGDLDRIERELAQIVGQRVDLVEREAVEESPNYIRRRAILGSVETLYEAR